MIGSRTPTEDVPAAPDGSDRRVGGLRRPDPRPLRGPAAGVPDLDNAGLLERLAEVGGGRAGADSERLDFQHASERRFAKILDFYRLRWEYEPDEFPIEWDDDGTPRRWFRPDFYLPDFDLYIEITTSQQRLVTKKNRKLRLLREHYPHIRCKLFYQRDYLALLQKFGIDDELAAGEPE